MAKEDVSAKKPVSFGFGQLLNFGDVFFTEFMTAKLSSELFVVNAFLVIYLVVIASLASNNLGIVGIFSFFSRYRLTLH